MPRRVSPMATPLTRGWRGLADDAIAAKAGAEHGQRGQRVVEVAQRARATPILIRRAVTARVALMRLEERGIAVPDAVFSLPVGVAEAVARWAGRDPTTAWRHADDYAQDRISFQALINAERLSRTGETAVRKPRPRRDDPTAWRAAQVKRLAAIDGRRVTPPAPDDLPVTAWMSDGTSKPTAVLVIGPYESLEAYIAARTAACINAVGIARLVGRAIMIVPSDMIALRYAAWLSERSVPSIEVGIETIVPSGRRARQKLRVPESAEQSATAK